MHHNLNYFGLVYYFYCLLLFWESFISSRCVQYNLITDDDNGRREIHDSLESISEIFEMDCALI